MRIGKRHNDKKSRSRRKDGNNKSTDTPGVGKHISSDLISTIFLPKIEDLATQSVERYTSDYVLYQETLRNLNTSAVEVDIGPDGSVLSNQNIPVPPQKPLFHSEYQFNEFKASVLTELSDHFFMDKGGWRIQANAAKFERLLDAKYGVFRPFITSHPEIDQFIRSVQRKYALGYFSPFRQTPPPISRGNTVILLFMMNRGKVSWQVTILVALFLLVGLQPWALVGVVALIQLLLMRRKQRTVGKMKKLIAAVKPYYKVGLDDESTFDENVLNAHKQNILLQPVGTSLDTYQNEQDIADTSNFDVIMIGSAPGTLYTAALLARAGRKVLMLCPKQDASACLTIGVKEKTDSATLADIPFDVECCNIGKISRQQQLMTPALCTESDYQGGIRFAQIGCENDGYAFEILSVPGMGTDTSDQQNPFVLCAAGGVETLMDQTANILGDGWPDGMGGIGQSVTGAYVSACEAMNASSGEYYLSKILPESVNKLRNQSTYTDCTIRSSSAFLNNIFPLNVHTRSLMAAIGMKNENIRPSSTSMAAHVTNICSALSGEGMHYPIGGPRALSHSFATVIEQNGGRIVTNAQAIELIFDESINVGKSKESGNKNDEDGPPPPCCVGVRLVDGREIRFDKSKYTGSRNTWPAVISTEGFIHTFIRMLSDDVRTKYKVPRGLPALAERRPVFRILFALQGNANDLDITGADYYRLPGAAVARDEIDPVSGEIKFGEIGWSDGDDAEDEAQEQIIDKLSSDGNDEVTQENIRKESENRRKKRHAKFTSGSSWMHISFPSAKDPSFESRHGRISTCVITIEADDDFAVAFDTKPKIYVIKKQTSSTGVDLLRLFERVKKDLLEIYPQFIDKIEQSEVRGPYFKGLKQNPERFAAKGIRPETPYPCLYVGGTDLTVDTFSGSIVAGWLVANAVSQYQAVDHLFLAKNITTDIEQFLEPPIIPEEEDVAVPLFIATTSDS